MFGCIDESIKNFEHPEIYTLILHILSCLVAPIHFFGVYCIVMKTPKQMSSVKIHLLTLHFFSGIVDILFSFVTVPYVLFPAFAGYALGPIGNYPAVATYLVMSSVAIVATSIINVFENRFHIISKSVETLKWTKYRKFHRVLNYFVAFIYYIPPFFMMPEPGMAAIEVAKLLPCKPDPSYKDHPLFVITLDATPHFYMIAFITVWTVGQACLFFLKTFFKIKKIPAVSQQTIRMQRNFTIAFGVQAAIVVTSLATPVLYILFTVVFNFFNMTWMNSMFVVFSVNGVISTIIMICIHQPYREATWQFVCCGKKLIQKVKTSDHIQVSMVTTRM